MNPIHNLNKVKIQDFSWRHDYVCNRQCTIGSPQSSGFHWPDRIKNFPMIDSSLLFIRRMENFTQYSQTKFVPSSFQIDWLSQSEAIDVGNSSRFFRLIKEWVLSHREQDQLGVGYHIKEATIQLKLYHQIERFFFFFVNTQTIMIKFNDQIHRIEESTLNLVTVKINLFNHKFVLCAPSSMLHLVCKKKDSKTISLQLAFIMTWLGILHIGTSSWWFHQVNLGPSKAISMSSQQRLMFETHFMRMIFWSQNLVEIIHENLMKGYLMKGASSESRIVDLMIWSVRHWIWSVHPFLSKSLVFDLIVSSPFGR